MNAALDYAENRLGVHTVYEEAQESLAKLDETLTQLDSAIDKRRTLDDRIADREMDLLIEERGKHPDHSEAAFARHLKEVQHKDTTLRQLKADRNAAAGEVSGLELDVKFIENRLKVETGRLNELGGYFQFLAAVKNAEPPPVQYAEAKPQGAGGETTQPTTTEISQ